MAGGKKAADPTKATPAETPAEPTERTRDATTLALLQALALKGASRPSLWRPSNDDEADRYLIEANKTSSREEYRHMLCYGVYRAAANAAAKIAMATLLGDADEAILTYLRLFKAKKALNPEEQVAERLIYFRVFDTAVAEHERSANVVGGLLAALEDKRLEVNIRGTLYRLCGLPMGWSLSPYYFTTFTMAFVKHMQRFPTIPAAPGNVPRSRRWLRRAVEGARILPYIDDYLFAPSEPEALELNQHVPDLQDSLGLLRNPAKGLWKPVQ
eukprot:jgi/Tetstr1/466622/TSEL_011110.t1